MNKEWVVEIFFTTRNQWLVVHWEWFEKPDPHGDRNDSRFKLDMSMTPTSFEECLQSIQHNQMVCQDGGVRLRNVKTGIVLPTELL